jgi:hypothetical protein
VLPIRPRRDGARPSGDAVTDDEARNRNILVATAISAVGATVLGLVLLARYLKLDVTEDLLFSTDDRPPTSIPDPTYVIGPANHTFGDFVVMYENVIREPFNPYFSPVTTGTPYGSVLMLILKGIYSVGPYRFHLILFLIASVAAMLVPAVWAARRYGWADRVTIVMLFGLLPFPALMALDRGNPQSLLLPVLFGAALWIERHEWVRAAMAIVIGAFIKFYPLLLVIPLLALRKFRVAAIVVAIAAGASAIALAGFAGPWSAAWQSLLDATRNHSGRVASAGTAPLAYFNWSTTGGLVRTSELMGLEGLGDAIARGGQLIGLALLALIAFTLATAWGHLNPWMRATLYLSPLQLCFPLAYPYTMTWVLIPIAFALRDPRPSTGGAAQRTPPTWLATGGLIILALAASLKPTWAELTAHVAPATEEWRNAAQLLDSLSLTALVLALCTYAVWRSRTSAHDDAEPPALMAQRP